MIKNIGLKIEKPSKECQDKKCPIHGNLKVHGRIFTGHIIKKNPHKTATIEFQRQVLIPKYERYEKKRTRIKAHNPPCIDANIGDIVKIIETRPISKTKNFVIIEKCNH